MTIARAVCTSLIAVMNKLISSPPKVVPARVDEQLIAEKKTSTAHRGREAEFWVIAAPLISVVQLLVWVDAACELAVVFAAHCPSKELSTFILRYLTIDSSLNAASAVELNVAALIAWITGMAGCILRYSTFFILGDLFTFRLAIRENHHLIMHGPYSVVRHPSYTGSIIASIGTGFYLLGPGSYTYECGVFKTIVGKCATSLWIGWKIYLSFNLVRRVRQEDAFLNAEFGKKWVDWADEVPYALFPGLF